MSLLSKVVGWFTGGGKTVEKVVDMADKAIDTQQERSERDASDLESARAMQLTSHGTWFDSLVDGLARLVRPGVTLWLVGGLSAGGLFREPRPSPSTGRISSCWYSPSGSVDGLS